MTTEFNRAKENVKTLKGLPNDGYLYYNGSEGREFAIQQGQWKPTYEEAVKELASDEGVTEQDIINDYKDRYYIELISEALKSEEYDMNYYSK